MSQQSTLNKMVEDLIHDCPNSQKYDTVCRRLAKRYKYQDMPSKQQLGITYDQLHSQDPIKYPMIKQLRQLMMVKSVRSSSGILNVSISLPPDRFSCTHNCYFCPNQPGMPRSYLSNEDVFKRAQSVNYDIVKQCHHRFNALKDNGHPIDKVEYRLLGGTFSCYAHDQIDLIMRDLYYSANIYTQMYGGEGSEPVLSRSPLTLHQEQEINTTSSVHIVVWKVFLIHASC